MESTFKALGDLLIQAIPTILFFILLTVFLNAMLFKPLGRVLEERRKATDGTRELARQAFEAADRKTSEFEHALQLARGQIHQENEALRRKWADEQAQELVEARVQADAQIEEARRQIAQETQGAKAELEAQVQALSERITNSLLNRRAA